MEPRHPSPLLLRFWAVSIASADPSVLKDDAFSNFRNNFDWTMVVTMIVMGVVQVALNEIIDMVAVGHRLVPQSGPCLCATS